MGYIARLLLLCGCFILQSTAWAKDEINLTASPAWLAEVSLPSLDNIPREQVRDGVHYLLLDRQVRVPKTGPIEFYNRYADFIVNTQGVEGSSQIAIDYDPSYQTLELHQLQILRDGAVIDKRDSARMQLIQREQELEQLIYNGETTLSIILDDVRVGDTLLYSYSVIGQNPVFGGIFSSRFYTDWTVPVGKLSIQLLWQRDAKLHVTKRHTQLEVVETEHPEGVRFSVEAEQLKPALWEDDTPRWYSPWGVIYFEQVADWSEVARWSEQLFNGVYDSSDELEALAREIQQNNSNPELQIAAALRFVQDEVRYLGLELGQNSHIPRPAAATLTKRYGDCKDKTVLFISLLDKLGISAQPALVNTRNRLLETPPRIAAFNHVIATLEHQGKRYWLDPTRNYQRGTLELLQQPNFGSALIVDGSSNSLTKMSSHHASDEILVEDRFDIAADGTATFSTETLYSGLGAEQQRRRIDRKGLEKLQREYLEFFQGYYPQLKPGKKLQIEHRDISNQLQVKEQYRFDDFWHIDKKAGQKEADFYANIISPVIDTPSALERQHPLAMRYPEKLSQQITVQFPDDNWAFDDEDFVEDNPFFYFEHQVRFDKHKRQLKLHYQYQSRRESIAPEEYGRFRKAMEKAENTLSFGIYRELPEKPVNKAKKLNDWLKKLLVPKEE